MLLLSTLIACQVMDNPGHVFSSVAIAEEANENEKGATKEGQSGDRINEPSEDTMTEDKPVDPLFADPQAEVIQMGTDKPESELPAVVSPEVESVTATEEVVEADPVLETLPAKVQPTATSWRPATVKDGWRPTLVGTLMDGPTPRAILAMPSGEERVVKAGDMLSDDGVVVMTIGDKFIELAVIRSAEGRAQIENLTLSTQF